MDAITRAAQVVGSQAELARCLGVSRRALWQWKDPKREVPAKYCPAIERATGGKVTCEELRPDVDWSYMRRLPTSTPRPEKKKQQQESEQDTERTA